MDKSNLLYILEDEEAQEKALLSRMNDQERNRIGSPETWSARDLIAHINSWKLKFGQNLLARAEGRPLNEPDEDDIENARIYTKYQKRDWDEIQALASQANKLLQEQIRQLSQEDLEAVGVFPWEGDRPFWRVIAGTGYLHPILHITTYARENGHLDVAETLNIRMAHDLATLDENPEWQGIVVYNLACHYSLSGQIEKALDALEESFNWYPEMKGWAAHDSDLKPLRELPRFTSLIQE